MNFYVHIYIFTKSVYTTTDYNCKHLKRIIGNKSSVVVSGDKESRVVLMNKTIRISYNAAQVIAKYLKLLCSVNNYITRNTQKFPIF